MSLTQGKNYAQSSGFNPQIVVSFFNELSTERKTMLKAYVSFFNELSTERKLCSWTLLDDGFPENNALEGYHVKGKNSVMASKRYSLDGIKSLWKQHMSRVAIGVRRSGSNNPIEDITMSTTRSKSLKVEGMGDNIKSTSGGETECISSRISSRGGRKEDQ
jgi:hypothetical protein